VFPKFIFHSSIQTRWAESRRFLYRVDDGLCAAIFGIPADCTYVLKNVLRLEAQRHRSHFGTSITGSKLAAISATFLSERINRQYTGARPLAVSIVIASTDSIFSVDCFGDIQRYEGLFSSILAFPCSDNDEESNRLNDSDPIFEKLQKFYRDEKQFCLETTSVSDFIQGIAGLDEMVSISSNSVHFSHIDHSNILK